MAEAKTNSRESFMANRYLLERGWMPKDSSKGGRPSKDAIRKEAHQIASEQVQVNDDFQRLMRVQ
jgi:hypothetical protein